MIIFPIISLSLSVICPYLQFMIYLHIVGTRQTCTKVDTRQSPRWAQIFTTQTICSSCVQIYWADSTHHALFIANMTSLDSKLNGIVALNCGMLILSYCRHSTLHSVLILCYFTTTAGPATTTVSHTFLLSILSIILAFFVLNCAFSLATLRSPSRIEFRFLIQEYRFQCVIYTIKSVIRKINAIRCVIDDDFDYFNDISTNYSTNLWRTPIHKLLLGLHLLTSMCDASYRPRLRSTNFVESALHPEVVINTMECRYVIGPVDRITVMLKTIIFNRLQTTFRFSPQKSWLQSYNNYPSVCENCTHQEIPIQCFIAPIVCHHGISNSAS